MNFFADVFTDNIILSCLIAIIFAQIAKVVVSSTIKKRFDTSVFLTTGGMPSGHASVVSALAASIYLGYGGVTPLFAMACVIALIVIYDSMTIRRAVGHHTTILNEIVKMLKIHRKYPVRELQGHTFIQIIAGLIIGITISFLVNLCL